MRVAKIGMDDISTNGSDDEPEMKEERPVMKIPLLNSESSFTRFAQSPNPGKFPSVERT